MKIKYDPNLLSMQLREALDLWLVLSGVDPHKASVKISLTGAMDERTVKEMHSEIAEALNLDPSNITGYLLLRSLSEIYFSHRTFTIRELIEQPSKTAEYLNTTRKFLDIVQAPEMIAIGDDFIDALRRASGHYHAKSDPLMELLEKPQQLAFLRRDALRSMKTLRVDQFLSGERENSSSTPVYLEKIHRFWNINSLIRACCTQPSGISLNLVVDPDNYHSYFVFAVRNGGNLYTLSDVPVNATPLARYESRRPDREFLFRRSKHWFPYELLGMKFHIDEDGNRHLYFDRSDNTEIVPIQQSFEPLSSIQDCDEHEFLWIVMMFDLIIDRFWHSEYKAPALSYTGGMVRNEPPLSLTATEQQLHVDVGGDLNVKRLTKAEISSSQENELLYGKNGGSHNKWLEDRYADQISDEIFNLVANPDTCHYLPSALAKPANAISESLIQGESGLVTVLKKESRLYWRDEGRTDLACLDASSFGTAVELEANRRYIARYNYAMAIQRLADAEYELTIKDVIIWYKSAINKNLESLLNLVGNREIRRLMQLARFPGAQYYGRIDDGSFLFMAAAPEEEFRDRYSFYFPSSSDVTISGGINNGYHTCLLTNAKANVRVMFAPRTAEDIAFLVGQAVAELPQVLQHWCAELVYSGNHRIDKVDPLAWALRNPWERSTFAVTIWLSKRAFNRLIKS